MSRLLQFKAGKCQRRGETDFVDPLPERGLVYLERQDGLLHFCYKDLTTLTVVDDLIVFPGDAVLRSTSRDRVYVLQFSSSDARHFFWMQDVSSDQDSSLVSRVNSLIEDSEQDDEDDEEEEERDVEMASFSPPTRPSAPVPPATSTTSTNPQITASQLSRLEQILGTSISNSTSDSLIGPNYLLSDVLKSPIYIKEISNVEILKSFLPKDLSERFLRENFEKVLNGPEIKSCVKGLDSALLNSPGALIPMCESLGLRGDAAMSPQGFVEAVQRFEKEKEDGKDDLEI